MPLVDSLLTAIVRTDGDALVMHVGERPYVVASAGPIELSAHGLNLEAMSGMLGQLLPVDTQRALQEFGAIEHELPPTAAMAGDRFTVVAARGGDDIWIEIRRHRRLKATFQTPAAQTPPSAAADTRAIAPVPVPPVQAPAAVAPVIPAVVIPTPAPVEPVAPVAPAASAGRSTAAPEPWYAHQDQGPAGEPSAAQASDTREATAFEPTPPATPPDPPVPEEALPEARPAPGASPAVAEPEPRVAAAVPEPETTPAPATVVTLRPVARPTASRSSAHSGGLEHLLRVAMSRGASALYLTSQAAPAVRVEGEVQILQSEAVLSSDDVEAALLEILPEGASEALRRGETTEWIRDVAEVGRVRCMTFRDYRGPGALLRIMSARTQSAEQLGLSREIQALAMEPEGLVLVTGPRGSGKSTLVASLVDLINRQRADYVITFERQIRLVHESRHSLISQREVGEQGDEATAARAALREKPDVLVIEDLRSAGALQAALDAASAGLLVILSVTASATTAAVEQLMDLLPADARAPAQAALAETLRGAVSQVMLRKLGGGRIVARELLLNTAAVARLIAEGQLTQLPRAIEGGRRHGMVPLNDALVAFVQSGALDVRQAYRKAVDRTGLLAQLKREGLDSTFVERLA
jgi:twitching motility protein PilT